MSTPGKMPDPKHLLFIDAYDSFSESIAALLRQLLAVKITTLRMDSWTVSGSIYRTLGKGPATNLKSGHQSSGLPIRTFDLRTTDFELLLEHYDAVIVGPGPGDPRHPADLGIISPLWKAAERCGIPILGICLGFQSLCLAYGASIAALSEPCHGHAERILHHGEDIFAHVGRVIATNYHSLEVQVGASRVCSLTSQAGSARSSLSNDSSDSEGCARIQTLAWNEKGTLMAARHADLPFWGLQFHPESCRSNTACHDLLRNWWEAAMKGPTRKRRSEDLEISCPYGRPSQADLLFSHSIRDDEALQDKLQHVTHASGDIVQTHTFHKSVTDRDVAELCQSVCPKDAVAMLESTKKGRFCIYAMPSPDNFRLEYFERQDSARSEHSSLPQSQSYCAIHKEGSETTFWKSTGSRVLHHLEEVTLTRRAKGGHPDSPFWGGFIGYFSYEMGIQTLSLKTCNTSDCRPNADISLLWVERSVIVDKLTDTIHVQSIRRGDSKWIATMTESLRSLQSKTSLKADISKSQLSTIFASARLTEPDETEYKRNIQVCQSYLRAGSSYELCLTTEAQIAITSSQADTAWHMYQTLQDHNPAPFSAYLALGKTKILSSSPEQFLVWDRDGSIDMIPMKGTVSKLDPTMTLAKATIILDSPKESAENLMIADLIRHDLCSTVASEYGGSVEVVKLCNVVEHETVFHLVSHMRACTPISTEATEDEKQRTVTRYGHKALRQCIPPGSMTGAPKKRSCEILHELEKRPRGVYSGVLGYLDVGGGGGFNVCIRTAFSHTDEAQEGMQTWRVGAGGAITVLSDADAEWAEMRTKLDSVLGAFKTRE